MVNYRNSLFKKVYGELDELFRLKDHCKSEEVVVFESV